jgi:hypothetical protein
LRLVALAGQHGQLSAIIAFVYEGAFMAATIPNVPLPAGATVAIKIDVTAPINVTAFVARQKVTQFVIVEISNQLRGDTPDLHVSERLCWSVPVVLTSPARGTVGRVGEILVDAASGEVLADPETVERIAANAKRLAECSCPLPRSDRIFG